MPNGTAVLVLDDAMQVRFANAEAGALRERGLLRGEDVQAALSRTAGNGGSAASIVVERGAGPHMAVLAYRLCGPQEVATLVVAVPLGRAVALRPSDIADAFALTRAESELLAALIAGETLARYCERVGISVNTGKTHLRQLFEKTHTNRQPDLIRMVLSNPAIQLDSLFR